MSSSQQQQGSLPRRPTYLNTGSPDLGPLAPEGGDADDRPYTDESGSEFMPSSSPLVIRSGRTPSTVSSIQASRSTNAAASPATPMASNQQSGSTASSSSQQPSDAPSSSVLSASSAADTVIFEEPAPPSPSDDAADDDDDDDVDTPGRDSSTHQGMESSSPARAPLAPIVSRNATPVNAPNAPSRRSDPDCRTIRTVVNGKTIPSIQENINFLQQFEEDEN